MARVSLASSRSTNRSRVYLLFAKVVLLGGVSVTALTPSVASAEAGPDLSLPVVSCQSTSGRVLTGSIGTGLAVRESKTGSGSDTELNILVTGPMPLTLNLDSAGPVECTADALVPLVGFGAVEVGPRFTVSSTGQVAGTLHWTPEITYGVTLSSHGFTTTADQFTANRPSVAFSGAASQIQLGMFVEAQLSSKYGPFGAGSTATLGPKVTLTPDGSQTCWSGTGVWAASFEAQAQILKFSASHTWNAEYGPFSVPEKCVR